MISTRRFSDIVYCIDSETRIWNGHIVPTDFLPFVNLVECQALDALAEEYVVHRLFEPESELSREEFALRTRAEAPTRFSKNKKKPQTLPEIFVVHHEGEDFLTMRFRGKQITAPAGMILADFARNRLLGLAPDATATPPWMTGEFADYDTKRGYCLPRLTQIEDGNEAERDKMLRMISDTSKCTNSTCADKGPALEHTVGATCIEVTERGNGGGIIIDLTPPAGQSRRATVESLFDWEPQRPSTGAWVSTPSARTSGGGGGGGGGGGAFTFSEPRVMSQYQRSKEASLTGWAEAKPDGYAAAGARDFPSLPLSFCDSTPYSILDLAAAPKSLKARCGPRPRMRSRVRGLLRWCARATAFISGLAAALIAPRARSRPHRSARKP